MPDEKKPYQSKFHPVPIACRHCGKEFLPTMQSQKYCPDCRAACLQRTARAMGYGKEYRYKNWQRRNNPEGVCQRCGVPITGYALYCKECRSAVLRGRRKYPRFETNRHCKICGKDYYEQEATHFCPDCRADRDKMKLWTLDLQWKSTKRKADELRAKIAARRTPQPPLSDTPHAEPHS